MPRKTKTTKAREYTPAEQKRWLEILSTLDSLIDALERVREKIGGELGAHPTGAAGDLD